MKPNIIQILTGIASLILLVIASMHYGGLSSLKDAIGVIDSAFFKGAIPGVWIMPSIHMIFIACLAFGLSFYKSRACAAMLIAFGAWCLVDAAIIFIHVGPFVPVYMLGVAGLCLLAAGFMLRRSLTKIA
ncbi:MAG: hypothetical protein HKN36_00900 [Hellea sp.]|nr:hypothetical protein [Hellea sp.]